MTLTLRNPPPSPSSHCDEAGGLAVPASQRQRVGGLSGPPSPREGVGGGPQRTRTAPRRRWLCIAYAFPPIHRSGTFRTLGFVKHLHTLGWDTTVLTVEPHGEPFDDALLEELPDTTRIIRVPWRNVIERIKTATRPGAMPERVPHPSPQRRVGDGLQGGMPEPQGGTPERVPHPSPQRRVGDGQARACAPTRSPLRELVSQILLTPDSRTGWIAPAVRAGIRAVDECRPDVIYSTSPYASAHLIALAVSRWSRLPWIADFRDPWCDNPFGEGRLPPVDRWNRWLERRVLLAASRVVCATPTMTARLVQRYPALAKKCTTILNGFDRQRCQTVAPIRTAPSDRFVFTHCGQFYGPRSPLPWFNALRRAIDDAPGLAEKVQFTLIGPDGFKGRSLTAWARDAGVADHVCVLGPKGHRDGLAHMAGSDALILPTADGAGAALQVPGKLFEYLTLKKPILAACHAANPTVRILNQARAAAIVCDPNDEHALATGIKQLAQRRTPEPPAAWSGVDQFDRTHRASELADVFGRALDKRQNTKTSKRQNVKTRLTRHEKPIM
ncbi:MAG: glycosyltransferase [Phycisphaerae bacterium]